MNRKLYRNRQIVSFLLGPLLCWVMLQCPPPEGLGHTGMKHLAAAAWILAWWVTELFPLAAVSLLSIPIYGIVDVMPPVRAYAIFGNSNLMLMVGAMIILGAWKRSGLITRYAYWVLSLPWIKGRPRRLMLVFAFATGLVSTIVPNIPVAILFVSLAVAMGRGINAEPGRSNTIRGLCVMSGVGAALGGAGTPIGGAPNLVVIGVIASSLDYHVSFAEWTALGMPICLLMLLAMVILACLFFPPREEGLVSGSGEYVRRKLDELGPITPFEHASMMVMFLAMLLWAGGQPAAGFWTGKQESGFSLRPRLPCSWDAACFFCRCKGMRRAGTSSSPCPGRSAWPPWTGRSSFSWPEPFCSEKVWWQAGWTSGWAMCLSMP